MGEAVMDVGSQTIVGRPGRPLAHDRRFPGHAATAVL